MVNLHEERRCKDNGRLAERSDELVLLVYPIRDGVHRELNQDATHLPNLIQSIDAVLIPGGRGVYFRKPVYAVKASRLGGRVNLSRS
jgi:hypothetical protein